MALFAVVPVKNLVGSKRRLSAVFTPQERKKLTLAMLEDVLSALKTSSVEKILVVGENSQVQQVAENCGASYLSTSRLGLNPAIEEATNWCMQHGACSVLVIPADVPLLKAEDVNRIAQLAAKDRAVVLSPSVNWGTNALFRCPPKLIPACFGPNSFLAHIRAAYIRGISVRLHFSSGLASDIDSAEDLKKLFSADNATVCRRVLEGIASKNRKAKLFFSKKN